MPDFEIYRGDGSVDSEASTKITTPVLFSDEGSYVADDELAEAVNIAICVGQPLLVTGEPGCGKTRLAWSVASELGLGDPLVFVTKSNSVAGDLLYTYDAVKRFQHIQTGNQSAAQPEKYVSFNALGEAIKSGQRNVVLIDEIDKAPRDFPNDLLQELDRMAYEVPELEGDSRHVSSNLRPIVIITSNSERQLPLPFLRRCVFHHIEFPTRDKLQLIIRERLGGCSMTDDLIECALDRFLEARQTSGLSKPPATSELLVWLFALHSAGVTVASIKDSALASLPLRQTLFKDRDDLSKLSLAH